jgi:hypothetical protein
MWQFVLQREISGSWCLFAPITVGKEILLLSFGDSDWDAVAARWTRPDLNDYENAERTLLIMSGKSVIASLTQHSEGEFDVK